MNSRHSAALGGCPRRSGRGGTAINCRALTPVVASRSGTVSARRLAPLLPPVALDEVAHTAGRGAGSQPHALRAAEKVDGGSGQGRENSKVRIVLRRQQPGGRYSLSGPVHLRSDRFPRGNRIEVGQRLVGRHQAMDVRRAGGSGTDRPGEQGPDCLPKLDDPEPEGFIRCELSSRNAAGQQIPLLLDPARCSPDRGEVIGDAAVSVVTDRARQFQCQPALHKASPSLSVPGRQPLDHIPAHTLRSLTENQKLPLGTGVGGDTCPGTGRRQGPPLEEMAE